jgi:V/A-type H+-transporting ATPase subunit K
MEFIVLVALGLVLSMVGLGLACINKKIKGKNAKRIFGINVTAMLGVIIVATIVVLTGGVSASAQEADVAGTAVAAASSSDGLRYIAAALSVGIAAIGSGIAVSATGSAALGALSEDSKIFGKAFVIVGLAEGIAIYGLIIAILILNA